MSDIVFLLNGEATRVTGQPITRTLLDWLRETKHLTGTKEGCNEGDCGACTVMVTDANGAQSLNACILLLPQLHGKAVRTVEGISGPDGTPHPVQDAMVKHHGSQCGFCTPGIVVSLAVGHLNGATNFDEQLAGNLCRCTGYAPIIRAAEAAKDAPVPAWMAEDLTALKGMIETSESYMPTSTDALADWYLANPEATLIGGATDVGLWVTKRLQDLPQIAFLNGIDDLKQIEVTDDIIRIGAGVTITDLETLMADYHPSFAAMLRRYSSVQIRNAATIGGNIANGSPIGDGPPALIALGAKLHLRRGDQRRDMPLEDYFVAYGKQDRQAGEFVEAISIPRQADNLKCYKLTKRFDQDISAVCGCFMIRVKAGEIVEARIAFGGMAGTPHRADHVEKSLIGRPWNEETITLARAEFTKDYTPMSDMRASAEYRLEAAQNMLTRYFLESQGIATNVLEVTA
ncbi:FAD-binding molybdopterin dehydrogenase [Marinosulfonomonas sp. PRT-SC04]|nr:FAD-binding molybdopterin dehydrogenase [Marinosulfonomonas sp. PRT-SC04]